MRVFTLRLSDTDIHVRVFTPASQEWWDSIHVKEGVVSWLMYDIIQHVHPEGMDIVDETAIIIALTTALKYDSGLTSRPILAMAKFRDGVSCT